MIRTTDVHATDIGLGMTEAEAGDIVKRETEPEAAEIVRRLTEVEAAEIFIRTMGAEEPPPVLIDTALALTFALCTSVKMMHALP